MSVNPVQEKTVSILFNDKKRNCQISKYYYFCKINIMHYYE